MTQHMVFVIDSTRHFTFEHHLKALVYLHLQEYESGRELLQVLAQDEFARAFIAPPEGVSRTTFFEAMNTRALPQLSELYHLLQAKAKNLLPELIQAPDVFCIIGGPAERKAALADVRALRAAGRAARRGRGVHHGPGLLSRLLDSKPSVR